MQLLVAGGQLCLVTEPALPIFLCDGKLVDGSGLTRGFSCTEGVYGVLLKAPLNADTSGSERERCMELAIEIASLKQVHGLAEVADIIERAREEIREQAIQMASVAETRAYVFVEREVGRE